MPIVLLVAFWIIYLVDGNLYWRLVMPEHMQPGLQYLEWVQFLGYSGAGIVAAFTLRRMDHSNAALSRTWIYLFLFGCIFLALEEISYGQRVFNFTVPEAISRLNVQHEMNIHNTKLAQRFVHKSYILVGLAGGLGWLSRSRLGNYPTINLVTPDWTLSTYFLPLGLFYLWVEVFRVPGASLHQELFEFILAIGVFLFSLRNYEKISSRGVL